MTDARDPRTRRPDGDLMPRRPRTRLMPGISVLVEGNQGPFRQILADGTPRGRTLSQWVKSSLAQRSANAACTNATGLGCDGAQRQRSGQRSAGHGTTARRAPGIALASTPKRLPGLLLSQRCHAARRLRFSTTGTSTRISPVGTHSRSSLLRQHVQVSGTLTLLHYPPVWRPYQGVASASHKRLSTTVVRRGHPPC